MKRIYYIIALLFLSASVSAQNLVDALRYSDFRTSGTARSTAMGNAFGALGGDFTSASINPAGIGLYRSSEFVFTPNINNVNADATYLNQTASESKYNLAVQNVGYVANFDMNGKSGSLVSVSLGVGYNRMNNFNLERMVMATNANSSLLDQFTANANAGIWSNNYEELAWNTGLLWYDEATDEYWNDITDAGHGQSQRKSYEQKGSIDEFVFSIGANFNHKFYLGATVGIHDVYFRETTSLYEYDEVGNIPFVDDFTFNTYLRTTGTGVNFKLGAIFKPTNELRLGLAVHTPTFYSMQDSYDNTMYSFIESSPDEQKDFSPINNYDYDLQTPLRAILSAAYVVGKKAILSVDYEFVDYSTIEFSDGGDGYGFFDENQDIEEAYKAVGNLRLGAEYRLNNNVSIRGGYEFYPSPFESNAFGSFQPNSNVDDSAISAGIGFKQGGFFFDAAYKRDLNEDYFEIYQGSDLANFETNTDNFVFTIGFRF